jgi:hypothetical protein
MSKDATGSGTPPESAEALTEDIERTRRELGETVEALVAKTDVKARAQHQAAEVAGRLRDKAGAAIGKAGDGARSAKQKVAEHGPAAQALRDVRVYTAAAATAAALLLAWLTVRRRRR